MRRTPQVTALLTATLLSFGSAQAQEQPLAISDEDAPVSALEAHQQGIFSKVAPAVVFISTGRQFGSGFFVDPNGIILTNAHVVGKKSKVTVVFHNGKKTTGEVIERGSDKTDLALVKVNVKKAPFLQLGGFDTLRVGSWVASVGHGEGGVWTFTTGMISNIYPEGAQRPVFQTQIPLNPGASGGPIVDKQGEVVGIVTAGMRNSNSINFAIKADYAIANLKGLRKLSPTITIEVPGKIPVFVDGVNVGTGPVVVVNAKPKTYEIFAVINGKMVKKQITYPQTREVTLEP